MSDNSLRPLMIAAAALALAIPVTAQTTTHKKKPVAKAPAAPVVQAPPAPPPFVAPADPSTPDGEKLMAASAAFQGGFAEAKAAYAKADADPQLKSPTNQVPAQWVADAAAQFKADAAHLRELATESAPGLGKPASQTEVDAAYKRDGQLIQAQYEAYVDISNTINQLVRDTQIKPFLNEAAAELEKKHKDASAIRAVLARSPVVDMDGDPAYSKTAIPTLAMLHVVAENTAKQLETFGDYVQILTTTPGALPGVADQKHGGKSLKDLAGSAGFKIKGPYLTTTTEAFLTEGTADIAASFTRLEKYIKLDGFTTAPATAPTVAPAHSYMVIPGDFGPRFTSGFSGFSAKPDFT